jgi:cytochrome c peroxidase
LDFNEHLPDFLSFLQKMHVQRLLLIAFSSLILLSACDTDDALPVSETPEKLFEIPAHFPNPVYQFNQNKLTKAGFDLGKSLFYETLLSSNNSISCGSCHSAVHAFADHGSKFSLGVNNQLSIRNSPTLSNLAWYPSFMFDGGINHIEIMPVAPITNPIEMNESMQNVIDKLSNTSKYPVLFKKAFGTTEITDQRILLAMAQFMGAMVSATSKYDDVKTGKSSFTTNEAAGYEIFKQKCSTCHTEPLFTNFSFESNGLDINPADSGRALITQQISDIGKFKVPTLRNIDLTGPYMHDGRFTNLNQVLQFYSSNIKAHSNLSEKLPVGGLQLTSEERTQLIEFLKTLNDYPYISDPRFAE